MIEKFNYENAFDVFYQGDIILAGEEVKHIGPLYCLKPSQIKELKNYKENRNLDYSLVKKIEKSILDDTSNTAVITLVKKGEDIACLDLHRLDGQNRSQACINIDTYLFALIIEVDDPYYKLNAYNYAVKKQTPADVSKMKATSESPNNVSKDFYKKIEEVYEETGNGTLKLTTIAQIYSGKDIVTGSQFRGDTLKINVTEEEAAKTIDTLLQIINLINATIANGVKMTSFGEKIQQAFVLAIRDEKIDNEKLVSHVPKIITALPISFDKNGNPRRAPYGNVRDNLNVIKRVLGVY